MKVCIVGGVAGGASAATRLRRMDEEAEIVLFERGEYISYANCGLPYYIGGTIKDKEALVVTQPSRLRERFLIDVRTKSEVTAIDRDRKVITVYDHAAQKSYEESYDKLILSPGAQPKRPPLPGLDLEGVFTLRTVPDTFAISQYVEEQQAKKAVVVGGGFIGIEMAENLKERGLDVTVVEFAPQVVAPLDREMANILHRHLEENGVRLLLGTGLEAVEKAEEGLLVRVSGERSLEADMVILSIGVAPENSLAKEAGLRLSIGGSIWVNEYYQTSDKDIYAVGDAINVRNFATGKEALVPLAGPANKQGRIAAENVIGKREIRESGVLGSSVLKVFDMTAAATGANEKQLLKEEIPYFKVYVHPQSHASYYPGATPISMKMLFDREGKVLGAQAVGYEGVEKRIDVLAAVIRLHGTVYDLEEMELCYAPPYSSAKDPVNMLGFVAANQLRGDVKVFYAEELLEGKLPEEKQLVDVSTPDEVIMGTIEGSKNIPLDILREHLSQLDKTKPVYVFCRVGLRGYIASRILTQHGFNVYNLSGGFKTYTLVKNNRLTYEGKKPSGMNKAEEKKIEEVKAASVKTLEVDACGLQCPGPIMKVSQGMKSLKEGEQLCIRATDPAFASDIDMWCERTGNQLLELKRDKGVYEVTIARGQQGMKNNLSCPSQKQETALPAEHDKTMVVFSGDLDKAIASFIIANGAAAMDRKVTMFFTFWGLNILRKNQKVRVPKSPIEKMFGAMMPRGSKKLGLSRMNMGGMGAKMIRSVMKSKNVSSLEELIQAAIDSGIRIVACQMSMDVMGIKPEELIDGVEIGGVATFLGSAETSDTNLFI